MGVAEEAEDRTDSEDEIVAIERCAQCGVAVPTGGTRGQDGKIFCSTCWTDWERAHDSEMLALALSMSIVEAQDTPQPSQHAQLPNSRASELGAFVLPHAASSSGGGSWSERRW